MSDATCKTCPWWEQAVHTLNTAKHLVSIDRGQCRIHAPHPAEDVTDDWPYTYGDDWCGEHPERQPRIEYAEATLVTHDDDGPTAADMRRIVDALEQMAHCAAVKL